LLEAHTDGDVCILPRLERTRGRRYSLAGRPDSTGSAAAGSAGAWIP
jgi:hypothetical protein